MRKVSILLILLLSSQLLSAQNEIGPEGHKLFWVFGIIFILSVFILYDSWKRAYSPKSRNPYIKIRRIKITLGKDSLYYPDNLELMIKNSGNMDIDLAQPLLVFDNFWLKRKFRLKGIGNNTFYPLYLEKNKTHTLQIDLTRFYSHDKSLKKFPKAKVALFDVNGRRLGSKSVYLRKTLFKF